MGKFEELFDEEGGPDEDFRFHRKKRVGAYVLGRTLGEGSFAKVRLAVHLVSRERVAIKVVNKHTVMKRDYAKKNLHREAAMLQRLDHPNIIQLYEVMETDNHYYIVTELADGYDFMGYISERTYDTPKQNFFTSSLASEADDPANVWALGTTKYSLPEKEAQRYMRQIVAAVDHMHHSGVIHRDLKIENLMLDRNKNIKIIDFGLGNAWDGRNLLTTQCGSPAYAAPEIFSKRPYSTAVDIWSIGVNLYAMLTGSLPFTADPPNNLNRLHAAILKGCDPPSNISTDCRDVLMSLLETDEHKRIKMTELKDHSWIRGDKGPFEAVQFKTKPLPSEIDNIVVSHMVKQLGMDETQIRDSILNNKVNSFTATYQLLCKRKMRGLDGIPGMPREFLAQKWTPNSHMIGEMGTLKHGEMPNGHKGLSQMNNRIPTADHDRMLQRQQMTSTNITKGMQNKQKTMPSLRPKSDVPQPLRTRQNAQPQEQNIQTHNRVNHERIKHFIDSSAKDGTLDSYKDCLSKLRTQRERPNRSILKTEGLRPMPLKASGHYAEPPPAPPASSAGSTCKETLSDLEALEREQMLPMPHNDTHVRSTSASTKSVRFNLEPDTNNDDTSTVVSFRSQGLPSQVERLVLRRLSADKTKRDNILNMNKMPYNKNHWEINQDAIETLRKRASPDSMSLFSSGNGGRMRAMRMIKRADSTNQNPPPPPPNSALGRYRPTSNSRFVSSANASSRGGHRSGQNSHTSHNSKSNKLQSDSNVPNGLALPKTKHSDPLDNTDERLYNNYQFKVRKDSGARVLVWDLKVLDPGENAASPEPVQRSGSNMSDANMRKLGTLRGQVMLKPKQPPSEVTENLNSLKSLYGLPESRGPLPASRLAALDRNVTSSVMPPSGHTVKLRLRPVRSGALRSIKDGHELPVKRSDSFVAK